MIDRAKLQLLLVIRCVKNDKSNENDYESKTHETFLLR